MIDRSHGSLQAKNRIDASYCIDFIYSNIPASSANLASPGAGVITTEAAPERASGIDMLIRQRPVTATAERSVFGVSARDRNQNSLKLPMLLA
jgi:hypothetical protein